MPSKYASGVLLIAFCIALSTPARADLKSTADNILIGVVAGVAAVAVVVTVVVIHYSKKRAITGCINSGPAGMTVADDKDKQIYALSGNTAGIQPGDRMKLQGKKVIRKNADKTLVWETKRVTKDFGVCQP